MKSPIHTIFYSIEKTIKVYRRFAQKRIRKVNSSITLDQIIILKLIFDNKDLSQKELAELLFKDAASMSKIIQNLIKKDLADRYFHESDRRRFSFNLTKHGEQTISQIFQIVKENRKIAMEGLEEEEIEMLERILQKIVKNCNNYEN